MLRPIVLTLLIGVAACPQAPSPKAVPIRVAQLGDSSIQAAQSYVDKYLRHAHRADYLKLRQQLMHARPFVRATRAEVAEVVYGPVRSIGEGGGALGALDLYVDQKDDAKTRAELEKIRTALRLAAVVPGAVLSPARLAQVTADAAYEVSLTALGAEPGSPAQMDAVAADTLGMIAALRDAIDHLGKVDAGRANATLQEKLRQLEVSVGEPGENAISDPLTLVTLAGVLGSELREWLRDLGWKVDAPYQLLHARGANDVITPLHLPSLYRDLRPELVALGEKLFFDASLSQRNARSCASCHQPARAFSDGLVVPPSLVASHRLTRNTPTLLYAALQAVQMWDGRILGLRGQALGVIHTPEEMGLRRGTLAATVAAQPDYAERFGKLFPAGVSEENVGRALAAFEAARLVPGRAPIDRFAEGDEQALSHADREGFSVFVRQGRCMRCHVPPLFGGTRPSDFAVPVFAVLGVPGKVGGKQIDSDRGRGAISNLPLDQNSFKTPTLRNVGRTAPYFHHGRFATLEQVVDFYDQGGGVGNGIAVANQDPDIRPLHLTVQQRKQLLHFLRVTLQDTD